MVLCVPEDCHRSLPASNSMRDLTLRTDGTQKGSLSQLRGTSGLRPRAAHKGALCRWTLWTVCRSLIPSCRHPLRPIQPGALRATTNSKSLEHWPMTRQHVTANMGLNLAERVTARTQPVTTSGISSLLMRRRSSERPPKTLDRQALIGSAHVT